MKNHNTLKLADQEIGEIWVKVNNYRYFAIVDLYDCFFYEEGQKRSDAPLYSTLLPGAFSRLSANDQKYFLQEILSAYLCGILCGIKRERNNLRKYLSDNE